MSRVIRVPSEIYDRLASHADGFDTPASVIESLLDYRENRQPKKQEKSKYENATLRKAVVRDKTKYLLDNHRYGKNRLVLAVIADYASKHPEATFDDLMELFPKDLQGSAGVFTTLKQARENYQRTNHKRHFISTGEYVDLADGPIAVSIEWSANNINSFIHAAEEIGYEITALED